MRFAWLRAKSPDTDLVRSASKPGSSLMRTLYNLAFWVFLLPFFTQMPESTAFILFSIVIGARSLLNLYTNNVFKPTPQQFEDYPFRIP